MAVQMRTVLGNLQRVLEDAGATLADIVKTTVYTTDLPEFQAKARPVRHEFFKEPFPASTLIGVAALARPEWLLEIEAIAAVD